MENILLCSVYKARLYILFANDRRLRLYPVLRHCGLSCTTMRYVLSFTSSYIEIALYFRSKNDHEIHVRNYLNYQEFKAWRSIRYELICMPWFQEIYCRESYKYINNVNSKHEAKLAFFELNSGRHVYLS